jgi:hypothetical protein
MDEKYIWKNFNSCQEIKFLNFYHWYKTDVLSDIGRVVRYIGMHKHSVLFYMFYVAKFGIFGLGDDGQGH